MVSRRTVATILAILVNGVGHIYLGSTRRGITILAISIALFAAAYAISIAMGFALSSDPEPDIASSLAIIAGLIALGLAEFVLWIWQIFDARKIAKRQISPTA